MRRSPVTGGYELEADGTVGFAIGPHDPRATLVIDPSLSVSYSTFLGGSGQRSGQQHRDGRWLETSIVGGTTTNPVEFFREEPRPQRSAQEFGANPSEGTNTEYFVAKINPEH